MYLGELLEVCRTNEKPVVSYSGEDTLFMLDQIGLTVDAQLIYLGTMCCGMTISLSPLRSFCAKLNRTSSIILGPCSTINIEE